MMKSIYMTLMFMLCMNNLRAQRDTTKSILLVSDMRSETTGWIRGYQVRELRSSLDKDSSVVECCWFFWEHVGYLNQAMRVICKDTIVWDCRNVDWEEKQQLITTTNNIKASGYGSINGTQLHSPGKRLGNSGRSR